MPCRPSVISMPQEDDKLNAFLAVTSADPELAQQLLDSNQGDLEKAIESYFAIKEAETELDHSTTQVSEADVGRVSLYIGDESV